MNHKGIFMQIRKPRTDLTGQRIGMLTVVKDFGFVTKGKQRRRIWLCRCDCGVEKKIEHSHLRSGNVKSCGNHRRSGPENPLWGGYGEISGNFWDCISRKRNSPRMSACGREFTVTIRQAWDLFVQQNRKCALSGVDLIMPRHKQRGTASLDRVDSTKGYTLDNVQWVHKDVNRMKNIYPQDYFIQMCKKIAAKH